MTTPIPASSPAPTPAPAASGASATSSNGTDSTGALNFTQNFNTFLTLLTTQLKNQDPLNPTDTSQFTNQLVSFSEVEQQIKTNSQLTALVTGQNTGQAISALPLVGRTIEYTGDQTVLQSAKATFSYTLPTTAAGASLRVQDANGATVFSQSADPSAGHHNFVWNGQTNSGQQLPDGGTFTLQVLASDANGKAIPVTTTATGTVSSVSIVNNVATFDVSGIQVPLNQLVNIVNNAPATASN